ncbi:MAG TPA: hypothetical protein PKD52_07635 [Clostridiales bacterium]|nr:hypothetical protein [Clostridiales bacterium]
MKKIFSRKRNRTVVTFLLGIALCLTAFAVLGETTADAAGTKVTTYIDKTVAYAKGKNNSVFYDAVVKNAGSDSTDQLMLALGRYTAQTVVTADEFANYLGYVNRNLTDKKGVLSSADDYLDIALAVGAAGGDVTAAGTDSGGNRINLLYKGIYSRSITTLRNEGTATVADALLTLDALHVSDATLRASGSRVTRAQLKEELVTFAKDTSVSDISLCGLVLQALGPYYCDQNAAVVAAVDILLPKLSGLQATDGSFKDSVVATGQLLTGICALGLDPADNSGVFRYSIYDGLLTFYNSDGGFGLSAAGSSTASATHYGRIALVAYWCYQENAQFFDFAGLPAHTAKAIPASTTPSSPSSSSSSSSSSKSSKSSKSSPASSSASSSDTASETASDTASAPTVATAATGTTIEKSVFEELKGQDKTYIYEGTWNEGEAYTISFYGKNILTPMDFNAEITSITENQLMIDAAVASPECITFLHQGNFPGNATVTVTVSVPDGAYQCYYYNAATGGFELVGAVTVSDAMVSFEVNKGGDYFLTTEEIDTGGIVMNLEDTVNGVVPQSVFEGIKGKDVNLRLKGATDRGTAYAIVFNGLDVANPMDFNMQITETSEYSDAIAQLADNAWILHFDQDGDIPGTALVEIATELDEADAYTLFYYDETAMQASYVEKVSISDGTARFTIDHCSDYFIAQRAIADSLLDTGFTWQISPLILTYLVVVAILLAAGVGLLLRRRGGKSGQTGAGKKQKKPTARQQIAARKKAQAAAAAAAATAEPAPSETAPSPHSPASVTELAEAAKPAGAEEDDAPAEAGV